jgi:hypothetical protein
MDNGISLTEVFREIWMLSDELARKDGDSGVEERRERYLKI